VQAAENPMKIVTFFESIGSWLKAHFKTVPALEVTVSSAVNYLVPFVEELDTLATPEIAPVVNPILDKIKTGLAALAVTITDSSPSGVANVKSVLASIITNASSLEAAFQIKDPATATKLTSIVTLITGEVGAIRAQLG
jgi:hypothetical protein